MCGRKRQFLRAGDGLDDHDPAGGERLLPCGGDVVTEEQLRSEPPTSGSRSA
jgi:hypothetical protein